MTNGPTPDARRFAPATLRNRDAILAVLRRHLPPRGLLLEVASGSGEHALHFAAALPGLVFQPSDHAAEACVSIDAWAATAGLPNIRRAITLDAAAPAWPIKRADAVLCINMIHIAPWAAAEGLFRGAARLLPPGGGLFLYGPFRQGGAHSAPSNTAFDMGLQAQDPSWGVRDLEAVVAASAICGFTPSAIEPMPANNLFMALSLA